MSNHTNDYCRGLYDRGEEESEWGVLSSKFLVLSYLGDSEMRVLSSKFLVLSYLLWSNLYRFETQDVQLKTQNSQLSPHSLVVPVLQVLTIAVSILTRIIHEHFCCNRRSTATASLRSAGSPLGPSTYCTSTPQVLRAPRAALATRLSDFATNRHE